MMEKIARIIEIKSAYSTQVNLREEYGDEEVNLGRMERYMPISSHRSAFEKIARALYEKDNKRFYLLTGSYGTGKSHLCLMLANYLSHPSTTAEMSRFFENFEQMAEQDGGLTKSLDIIKTRRNAGKFLVCICDYDSNDTYMEIVLKSIIAALERDGIDSTRMITPYREAVRKLEEWKDLSKDGSRDFYSQFEKLLTNKLPGTSMNQFIKGLDKDLDSEILYTFKQIHKEITTVDFVLDKSNLVSIVKELISSPFFKDNYQGIAILFDEFDYILKGKRFDLNIFQAFGEFCSKSYLDGTPVFMVATGHKSFISYKSRYNEDDFSVVSNRVEEVSLKTEGFEDIISAIVIPDKKSALWNKHIKSNRHVFDTMTQSCSEHDIFTHLSNSGKKLREKIIENIYPMHPMATYVLLELSKDIASNNRSVFTFFTEPFRHGEEGSYNWFIHTHDIVDLKGNLNFYTVDYLFNYFSQLISSDNTELPDSRKIIIRNFEASLREWRKINAKERTLIIADNELWAEKILRVLVLYNLSYVVPNESNILFGLNANSSMSLDLELRIKSILRHLAEKRVLFYNKQTDTYEFKKNDLMDIDAVIEEYVSKDANFEIDLINELQNIGKDRDYPEMYQLFREDEALGKSYNQEWTEDKRFLRIFTTLQDLEGKSFFEITTKEVLNELDTKKAYEGIAVIVICESLEERERAKTVARTNRNSRMIIAVPREDIAIKEQTVRFIATKRLPDENLTEQELALIRDKRKNHAKEIAEQLKRYCDDRNLVWFEKEGNVISTNNRNEHEAVSSILQRLYDKKRTRIKHPDLNKLHSIDKTALNVLREGVDRLLDLERELLWDNGKAEDTADLRIFHRILASAHVIEIIEHNKSNLKGKLNSDFEAFKETIPALYAMFQEISENSRGTTISRILKICKEFGLGQFASCLYFAVVIRYYSDSIYIKGTPHSQDVLMVNSYSVLEDILIKNNYPNAVIEIIDLNSLEKEFLKKVFQTYEKTSILKHITIDKCYSQLEKWFQSLPQICKVKSLYSDGRYHQLIDVFMGMQTNSMSNFIVGKLQTIVGFDEGNLLIEQSVKETTEFLYTASLVMPTAHHQIRDAIYNDFVNLFEPNNKDTDVTGNGVVNALHIWYESLTDVQKDISNKKHNSDSKCLVKVSRSCIDAEEGLLIELPEDLGLQRISNWNTDKSADYLAKVKFAKTYLENQIVEVEDARIVTPSNWTKAYEGNLGRDIIYYFKEGTISIEPPSNKVIVLFTDDGSDPTYFSSKPREITSLYEYKPDRDEIVINIVTKDSEGRHGIVRKYQLRAEKLRFQARMQVKERQLTFDSNKQEDDESYFIPNIPYNTWSLQVCIESIIKDTQSKRNVSEKDIKVVLQNLLNSLEG